ncbi:MAG: hypothetical protein K0S32_4395 [Bacteroidetes bacterium]|jgi:hypothetical protein|nr:hypothetical protein [Bacteroidota bacterium]
MVYFALMMRNSILKSSVTATFLLTFILNPFNGKSQTGSDEINAIHGNFQIDAQYYNPDSLIGAPNVPEKMLSNAFANINYQKGKFSAGVRYEAYNNVMQGFDPRYKGQGVVNRFVRYQDNLLDVTVGNIYEQFGSGLILRTYYEPGLLYDNSLDGIRVISNPYKGVTFKGLVGRQRSFFTLGPGIVRGVDGEININEALDSVLKNVKTKVILGGSFVSKFQTDADPDFHLPENVGAYGGRLSVIHEGFNFFGEYVMKENDPNAGNFVIVEGDKYYSYQKGDAVFLSASYAMKGLSFLVQAKRVDNMNFRSDRDANLQNLIINYLPATTKQHTYLMPAYNPYATQPAGEVGGLAEIQYKAKKGTLIGGPYGMDITLNYSQANGLKQNGISDTATSSKLYTTNYGEMGTNYYHDFFIEINRKFSKKIKGTFMYAHQFYNKNIVQFGSPFAGFNDINSNIGVVDITYKYKSNSAIRFEFQALFRDNTDTLNLGSWATGLIEWNPNSHIFVAVLDQFNYGYPDQHVFSEVNKDSPLQTALEDAGLVSIAKGMNIHYGLITAGYNSGPHRISVSYGKQRAGIFCVGGVCRNVPASNGFAISITSSF